MIDRPIAAKGTFPYPHRTVAQVDTDDLIERFHTAAVAQRVHPGLAWCAQCDRTVVLAAASTCKSPFCPLRKAATADPDICDAIWEHP